MNGKWPSGRVAEWPSGRVAEWPSGRVAEWPSGRVAEWNYIVDYGTSSLNWLLATCCLLATFSYMFLTGKGMSDGVFDFRNVHRIGFAGKTDDGYRAA